MTPLAFSLIPFPGAAPAPDVRVVGAVDRHGGSLAVRYELLGDLSGLSIPARADVPARRDRLWEDTCFELFLAAGGSREYREFNLSPAGHWNVYRFASCRQGMREDDSYASLPFDVGAETGALRLSLHTDIGSIVPAEERVEAAICAVVRTWAGVATYWALAHPGEKPDFHRRDGFVLNIPPEA